MKTFVLIILGFLAVSSGHRYDRCELARELASHGFPHSQLPDWICLVESESNFDTRATNPSNSDRSKDWGLFQINDRYWCKGSYPGGKNICKIDCEKILSSGLGYQIDCVRKIYQYHKFEAWVGWKNKCKGRNLPSLDHCFTSSAYFFTIEYDHLPQLLQLGNGLGLDMKFK
ncbi:lysozyme [Sergentomyia squamirostris]